MFFPVLTSHVVGRPVASDTMLRSGDPPHMCQSVTPFFGGDDAACMAIRRAETLASGLNIDEPQKMRTERSPRRNEGTKEEISRRVFFIFSSLLQSFTLLLERITGSCT